MQESLTNRSFTNKLRILFCIVLFEYGLFIFSGTSFSFLHGNNFFRIEADPAFWVVYLMMIPQFITGHQWLGILLDTTIVILLLSVIRNPYNNRLAILLFLLLFLFYTCLMGYLAHRNYQFGFFMIFIPFLFKNPVNRNFAYEATRYFLLFFYVSAAVLKISNNSLVSQSHFSHLLSGQFTPYFLEGNTGPRTSVNLYLMSHPAVSYMLYLLSFIAELTTVIGFFTKRFDKGLAIIILAFHFANWFLMDIAPFGQVAFICLLFLSKEMRLRYA
ncbi:MAG: hypothetical protein ABI741_02880 [Ferruginibacter sp.]